LVFDPQLNVLLLEPDFWYIAGIGLIILDILIGLEFFALSFGVGALLTGAAIDMALLPVWLVFWERALLVFSSLSLVTLGILKKVVPKGDGRKDINDY